MFALSLGGVIFTLFLMNDNKHDEENIIPSTFTELSEGEEVVLSPEGNYYISPDSPSKEETCYVIEDFYPIRERKTFTQVYDILGGRKANKLTQTSGVSPKSVYELIDGGEVFIAYYEDKVIGMWYSESGDDVEGISLLNLDTDKWPRKF